MPQHDETTLEPRGARTYELPSLSGMESAGILMLLMSLEDPGPDVVRAIRAGARWYEDAKITGIRQVVVNGDKKIVPDRDAPPLWARFYEIGTNRPFFCGRDGVKKDDLAEIEAERRNGYAWYGDWGRRVLSRYARWERVRPGDPGLPSSSPRALAPKVSIQGEGGSGDLRSGIRRGQETRAEHCTALIRARSASEWMATESTRWRFGLVFHRYDHRAQPKREAPTRRP